MPSLGTVYVAVKGELKPLGQALTKARSMVNKSAKTMQDTLSKLTFGNPLLAAAGAGGLGYGLISVAKGAMDVASSFEQMEKKLDVLTNGKGPETLDKLNTWAKDMPVNTRDAVDAFILMQAMGLEPTIDKMQKLVDVSAIFGGDTMKGVARALGQMTTNGRLLGEELNQLAERGINARKILTTHFGMTIEELQKSGIEIKTIVDAIWQGLDANYGGAAASAMSSWQGLVAVFESTVIDGVKQVMDAGFFEYMKTQLKSVNKNMKEWIDLNQDFINNDLPGHIEKLTAAATQLGKAALYVTENFINGVNAIVAVRDWASSEQDKKIKEASDFVEELDRKSKKLGPAPDRHKIDDTRANDDKWNQWTSDKDIEIPLDLDQYVRDLDFTTQMAKDWRAKLVDVLYLPLDLDHMSFGSKVKKVSKETTTTLADDYSRFLEHMSHIGTEKNPYAGIAESVASLETEEIPRVLRLQEEINTAREEAARLLTYGEGELYQSQVAQLDKLEKRLQGSGAWEKMLEEQKKTSKDMEKLADQTSSAMESAFSDVFFDAMTNQFKSLEDYVKNLLTSLAKMLANFYAQKFVQGLLSGIGGGGAATGGGQTNTKVAKGAIINERIVGYGESGTKYEIGEAGPEAVLPVNRMSKGGAPFGGGPNIKINIVNNSGKPIEQKSMTQETDVNGIVITAVIDSLDRNVDGFRENMKAFMQS